MISEGYIVILEGRESCSKYLYYCDICDIYDLFNIQAL